MAFRPSAFVPTPRDRDRIRLAGHARLGVPVPHLPFPGILRIPDSVAGIFAPPNRFHMAQEKHRGMETGAERMRPENGA